jgi:hypothetical protein
MKPAFKVAGNGKRMSYNGAASLAGTTESWPPDNPWKPYRLKLLPKVINERRYWPGDTVYRRWALSPGGGFWVYGDEFDYLKWQ